MAFFQSSLSVSWVGKFESQCRVLLMQSNFLEFSCSTIAKLFRLLFSQYTDLWLESGESKLFVRHSSFLVCFSISQRERVTAFGFSQYDLLIYFLRSAWIHFSHPFQARCSPSWPLSIPWCPSWARSCTRVSSTGPLTSCPDWPTWLQQAYL